MYDNCEHANLGHRFLNRAQRRRHNRYAGDFNYSRERGRSRHMRNVAIERDLRVEFAELLRFQDDEFKDYGNCLFCEAGEYDCVCHCQDYDDDESEDYRSYDYFYDRHYGDDFHFDGGHDDFEHDSSRNYNFGDDAEGDDGELDGEESDFDHEADRFAHGIQYSYKNWY